MEERESSVKKTLRNICFSYGCSYGVFWRFDPRNHMLLTMDDAYYEEHAGIIVDSMRLQVHMLGEGRIGEAAFDGKHRWVSVNSPTKGQNVTWEDSDFSLEILSGIKTIVVMPLELRGVVQFGFTNEILEAPEFLDQARKSLLEKDNYVGVSSAGTSSLNSDVDVENGLLASVISSQNSFHCNGNGNVSSSWANTAENAGNYSWMLDSLPLLGVNSDGKNRNQSGDGELVIDPKVDSDLSNPLDVFEGQFDAHCSQSLFDAYQMNNFSQWLDDPSKVCVTGLDPLLAEDSFSGIPGKQSAGLSHNPLHNALNLSEGVKSLVIPPNNDELLVGKFGIDSEFGKWGGECLKDVISPIGGEGNPLLIDNSRSISECISGVEGSSVSAPRKGLFSELGLEHLLRDGASTSSVTKSCIDSDQWNISKRRRIEICQTSNNQTQLGGGSWGAKSMEPINNGAQNPHFGSLKECVPKSQGELWIDDTHSMDAKSCVSGVSASTRRPEEPAKPAKKRARPGESTRPRPKDRQMIADRIKELRDLIPNASKLSIDALLGRTVKHMLFLQNLTKHADKLKKLDESKLIRRSKSLVQKENTSSICSGSSSSRDATWAYEVGGQDLFCPIVVEDLGHPGQMVIEMLCEERGYFLEIADIVRGLGLTIIKGVMESRDGKVWAHYIVEGNQHVTRMDVFVSLMQFLQGSTTTGEIKRASEPTRTINNGSPSWSNYQQHRHLVPLPI